MRTQYMIRRAGLADLDRILEIERSSFGREAYDRKLFAYYQERCGDLFLVSGRPLARGYYEDGGDGIAMSRAVPSQGN